MTNTAKLVFAFLGTAALGTGAMVGGCGSSSSGGSGGSATGGVKGGSSGNTGGATTGGSGGGSSGSTGGASGGLGLTPSATGYVSDDVSGVVGAWYAYGDSLDSAGTPGAGICSKTLDATKCSTFTAPALPAGTAGFPPSATGGMCAKGTVPVIVTDAKCTNPGDETGKPMPHCYATQFGAGIGLDFHNPGGEGGVKGPLDLSKYKGIRFDIDKMPKGDFRVELATTETGDNSPFWMSGTGKSKSPVVAGTNEFTWDQVLQPSWGKSPGTAMNPAMAVSIQFHAVSPSSGAAPLEFDFCISNLTLVQ